MSYALHSVGILLLLALAGAHAQFRCLYAVSQYRNCTCGVQYRTVEKRCCSAEECLQPEITTENITCPFVCQNGGTYDEGRKLCLCSSGYYGLCCERETRLCGDVFVKHTGEITSIDYPNNYPNNAKCIWRISTDSNRRIALGVMDNKFELEPGSNIYSCTYDYVKVFDGTSDTDKCVGIFCGKAHFRRYFKTVYSSGPHLYVKFSSDFIVQKKGFVLQYSVFFAGQECGPFTTFTRTEGTITSPQHPIPYRPNENCQWSIRVIDGHDVLLIFQDMNIKATVDCRYGDYLIVSGKTGNKLQHLTAFCGDTLPRPFRVLAERMGFDEVVLTFKSNNLFEGRGFVLKYRQVLTSGSAGSSESDEATNVE